MIINRVNSSVNFVDKNNVLVGYDMQQDCCEQAEWEIRENREDGLILAESGTDFVKAEELEPYVFDPSIVNKGEPVGDGECVPATIEFILVAEGKPDLKLTLSNSHNGYYAHGFSVEVGGKTIWNGYL